MIKAIILGGDSMATSVQAVPITGAVGDDKPLMGKFRSRMSEEVVIAFAGPIGCGIARIINAADQCLREMGYLDVVRIKLSDFLDASLREGRIPEAQRDSKESAKYARYRRLQLAGMEIRTRTGNQAILAEYAVQSIVIDRDRRAGTVPGRVAYLIDQVKRPEEVMLLRALYRNLFYLVGVTKTYKERDDLLQQEGVRDDEISDLIEIDRNESTTSGQKLEKTLQYADYFVRNDSAALDKKESVRRFLKLMHGDKSITPTAVEQGMYAAYAAGLRSACLSRQVGAAIAGPNGEVIATGCNDVPRAGGGLYVAQLGGRDMRCVHMEGQICFNDLHKRGIHEDIGREIDRVLAQDVPGEGAVTLSAERREALRRSIYENTGLRDLMEFSRSVHAEMDAIVSLARCGGSGVRGATLFTTTFPCHSCARHIVAAGIDRVFYIEPYEKSLAWDLHKDAISFEFSPNQDGLPRVQFLHFEGVAPAKFAGFFRATGRKDEEGKFIPINQVSANKTIPEYLDNYMDFETKAVQHFQSDLAKVPVRT